MLIEKLNLILNRWWNKYIRAAPCN